VTAPIVTSYTIYYFPRERVERGALLPTAPISGIEGTRPDGSFRLTNCAGAGAPRGAGEL
jgi:hypothetical protein